MFFWFVASSISSKVAILIDLDNLRGRRRWEIASIAKDMIDGFESR